MYKTPALLVGALLLLAPSHAFCFPTFTTPEARALLQKVFATEAGSEFARAILGARVARYNAKAPQEVIDTLLHPSNTALAETLESRLNLIRDDIRLHGDSPAMLKASAEQWLGILEHDAKRIKFRHLREELPLRTAYEIRRAEFVMRDRTIPVRVAPPAAHQLPGPTGFHKNAFEQFLRWEETASIREYNETTQFVGLNVKAVPASQVNLQMAEGLSDEVKNLFVRGDKIFWPEHPYSTAPSYFPEQAVTESWPARLTTSRSVVVWDKTSLKAFSVKSPTNFPHRTQGQDAKLDVIDDIKAGVYRTEYIAKMDQRLGGPDPELGVLPEVFSGANLKDGNGFIVRDLSALQDGHYYVPAFAIPTAGPKIAQLNGVPFDQFWGDAYARLLGRSKAKLLMRYGLQMETPNCQNMLIQFDRDFKPTGKLFFRDISDSQPVKQVAAAMRQKGLLRGERKRGFKIDVELNPMTSNSFWRLDEDPVFSVGERTLGSWMALHDQAYIDEVLLLLGYDAAGAAKLGIRNVEHLQTFLFSKEGQQAIARYHSVAP